MNLKQKSTISILVILAAGVHASLALACKGGSGGNGGGSGSFKLRATEERPYDPSLAPPSGAYPAPSPVPLRGAATGAAKPMWTQKLWFGTPPNRETGWVTKLTFTMSVNSSQQGTFPFTGLPMYGPTGEAVAWADGTITVSGHKVTMSMTNPYTHTWSFTLPKGY